MTTTDYLIAAVLVLLVIPQIRGMRIDLRSLLLPLAAVVGVAFYYLKAIPTGGHDVALDLATGAIGLALGILCGLSTKVFRDGDGHLVSKAGVAAAVLWIVGMVARTGFAYEADHGGAHAITTFSINNHITSADAWTAALVLMAVVQVLARMVVIRVKAFQAGQSSSAVTA